MSIKSQGVMYETELEPVIRRFQLCPPVVQQSARVPCVRDIGVTVKAGVQQIQVFSCSQQ